MRVYCAGPYTSPYPIYNIRNAIEVAEAVAAKGHTPFVPHLTGFWDLISPHPYDFWMAYDLEWLKACDIVLRFPGASSGADQEVEDALRLGIPVVYSVEELP